ncbi:MAG: 50S ribosomal protein L24 [Gammaproteobacteria bacterium]|nr:50S ribosomal protein L24 [Gammaproteobacteria bacterium]
MLKIKKGDEVVVITGKDKGRRGNVLRVMPDDRVVVENINMAKRHTKPNPNAGQPGGIIDKEMPMDASNVMLWNADAGKGDRVGFKLLDDGRKVRIFRSTGEVVDAT